MYVWWVLGGLVELLTALGIGLSFLANVCFPFHKINMHSSVVLKAICWTKSIIKPRASKKHKYSWTLQQHQVSFIQEYAQLVIRINNNN